MKIGIIESSHWHVPLYIRELKRLNHKIVGVSDGNKEIAKKYALFLNCNYYTDYVNLIGKEKPDFVFAFGRHCEMPRIARFLIMSNIPFSIEKPVCTSAKDLEELLILQDKYAAFVAVPFVFRYSSILKKITILKKSNCLGNIKNLYFRFIAASPSRYSTANCDWMLDLSQAGGGCTINLAVHFIDLFMYLVKDEVKTVYAVLNNLIHHKDVEDFSSIILRTKNGTVCVIETGYAYPDITIKPRDIYYNIVSDNNYLTIQEDKITWVESNSIKEENVIVDTDKYYPVFVREILNTIIEGRKPKASLIEMYKVMKVIDAVYESELKQKVVNLL